MSKNLSPLTEIALALDEEFKEYDRLSRAIDELSISSDGGLERAPKLLSLFSESGLRIGKGIQGLAKALDEARVRAEEAATKVAARANEVQERQQGKADLFERFKTLGDMVQKVSTVLGSFGSAIAGNASAEDKALLGAKLPELEAQIGTLADYAWKVRDDARTAGHKQIERDAESMAQSLRAARERLETYVGPQLRATHPAN